MLGRNGSPLTMELRFRTESNAPHCFLSRDSSASALLRSSRSSSTLLSWAAMACIKSFASVGDLTLGVAPGVGGREGTVVQIGVGRDDSCVGKAIGSVRDSLLELRDVVESERVEREPKDCGGESKNSSTGGGGGGCIVSDLESLEIWRLAPDSDLEWPE